MSRVDEPQEIYLTPPAGATTWAEPHPDADRLSRLGPNEQVRVLETRGVWARVRTETGAEVWIDGRRLQPFEQRAPAQPAASAAGTGSATTGRSPMSPWLVLGGLVVALAVGALAGWAVGSGGSTASSPTETAAREVTISPSESGPSTTTSPGEAAAGGEDDSSDPAGAEGAYLAIQSSLVDLGYGPAELFYDPAQGPREVGCDTPGGAATMSTPSFYNGWDLEDDGSTDTAVRLFVYETVEEAATAHAELVGWYDNCKVVAGWDYETERIDFASDEVVAWTTAFFLPDRTSERAVAVVHDGITVWEIESQTEADLVARLDQFGLLP